MSEHQAAPSPGEVAALPATPCLSASTPPQSEIERLTLRVQQLEEECQRNRQTIAALQTERDVYLRSLYHWTRKQVPADDWRRFAPEDYSVSSGEVLELLEQLQGNEHT
jgi:hypothetical protein